jgi:hypothetical protein
MRYHIRAGGNRDFLCHICLHARMCCGDPIRSNLNWRMFLPRYSHYSSAHNLFTTWDRIPIQVHGLYLVVSRLNLLGADCEISNVSQLSLIKRKIIEQDRHILCHLIHLIGWIHNTRVALFKKNKSRSESQPNPAPR